MPWILLAIISVVSLSTANLFQKIAMKEEDSDAVVSAIIFQFLLFLLSFLFALTRGFELPLINLLPYFLVSGCLYAYGTISFFRAIKLIEASEMTILSGAGVIVTILGSMLILGDRLSLFQLGGTGLILLAVFLVSWQKNKFSMSKGSWLAIIGTSFYGLAVVFDSFIIRSYSAISFLPLASLGPGLIMTIWYYRKIPELIFGIRKINKNLIFFTVLYVLQAITFYLGLEKGAFVGQMSTISKASIVLTVLLATVLMGERSNIAKKFIAAILVTIGVIMVA